LNSLHQYDLPILRLAYGLQALVIVVRKEDNVRASSPFHKNPFPLLYYPAHYSTEVDAGFCGTNPMFHPASC
jgi:hypothetical protein